MIKLRGNIIENSLFAILISCFVIVNYKNHQIYHSSAEIFSSMIAVGIFIISLNTYKISKNDFLMFLGLGYAFVGVLDLMHAFSYDEMNIFQNGSLNMIGQFWIASRLLELLTLVISPIFVYKKNKSLNFTAIFLIFFASFIFIALSILKFNIFPTVRINEIGFTKFKIVSEYVVTIGFFICMIIFYKARNMMDKSLFSYLEFSLMFKVLSEFLFAMNMFDIHTTVLIGHLFKVISFYFLYKAIIVNGLQRPFDTLIYDFDKAVNNLKEAERQTIYMEKAFAQNEQCYDLIINSSRDAIMIQREGDLIFANSTAAISLGAKDASEIIGKKLMCFMHEDSIELAKQRVKIATEKKSSLPFVEFKIVTLDGKQIEIEGSISYIIYRGKPAIISIFRDISYKKKIKSLEDDIKVSEIKLTQSNEYNKVLTEFFSNISHELKTPLNVLLNSIQLLEMRRKLDLANSSDNKSNNILDIMKQNSYRLLRLVNNLIDISKFDSGYLKLNLHNNDIVSIVEDITLSIAEYAKSKDVDIVFDTNVEEKIMAVDADIIERIILNLLSNAIKFTNKGDHIAVNIEDFGNTIQISVKDTGIGIPEDKLDIIFDRFGQVDKTLTRNREGSGIGLSLVKTLVEMHRGRIEVKSILAEGSEFIIELPVTIIEEVAEDLFMLQSKVEKINIELSDIYSNNN